MKKIQKIQTALLIAYAILPFAADAQTINSMVETVKNILNSVIPILFILATVIFLWGIVRFLTAAGDPNKVKEGRSLMLWGIVALAVMSSVWGLAKVLTETFKIQPGSIPGVPGTTPGTPPPGTPPPGYL